MSIRAELMLPQGHIPIQYETGPACWERRGGGAEGSTRGWWRAVQGWGLCGTRQVSGSLHLSRVRTRRTQNLKANLRAQPIWRVASDQRCRSFCRSF